MKKTLLISASLLILSVVTGIYAQTVAGTSLVDKMKAAAQNFTLSALLNPGETGLQSAPVKGKKTGDILTAGEWNRVLEIVSQGSAGGGSPMGKANLDTGWLNYYPTADPKFTDSAFVYGSKKLNFSDFTHNLGGNKDNYLVDVQYDQSEAGGGISEIPLHANNEDIVWHNLTNNSINLNNVHSPAVNIKVRIRIWDTSLASVSTNGAPAFYKCTNAQSLDATNTPCYGASRNGGVGTNQYRVVSCSNTDASGTYTAGGLLNFGDFIANKWSFHINNSNIACTDGSVLVMGIQGGGSGGSVGWEDVSLTDTGDFDDSCMYRYQITYSAGGREPYVPKETYYYANGMSKTQLVWWLENDSQNTTYHIAASSKNLLRINGTAYTTGGVSVTKIEKLCGGGGSSSSSGWSNISLTETGDFDIDCDYKFKLNDVNGALWSSINAVDAKRLIYISHGGQISHINSTSRNTYRVNEAPYYTVLEIKKRCN